LRKIAAASFTLQPLSLGYACPAVKKLAKTGRLRCFALAASGIIGLDVFRQNLG
jgi:hypothetical protein